MVRRRFLLLVLLLGFVLHVTPATADVISNVSLDWKNISVELIPIAGGTPAFVYNSRPGESRSEASTDPSDFKSDILPGGVLTDFSTDALTGKAHASAFWNGDTLSSYADSKVGTDPEGGENWASASAQNSFDFTLTGNGIALITLGWHASLASDDSFDHASAAAGMSAEYNGEGGVYSYVFRDLDVWGPGDWNGTLSMVISNLGGATTVGTFSAYTNADASSKNVVPEPASCVLMALGLGLVGWIGYRRRK